MRCPGALWWANAMAIEGGGGFVSCVQSCSRMPAPRVDADSLLWFQVVLYMHLLGLAAPPATTLVGRGGGGARRCFGSHT